MPPITDFVRTLLSKRGIVSPEDVGKFLSPDYERDTHSPMLLHDIERAVVRLLAAVSSNERIAIYADFDCDGIPGAVVLADFFRKIGYENFEVYLPHRDREGYGFHQDAIAKLSENGVSLIITVDVGTSAHESVRFAKEKGVDVIITDHHDPIREPAASNGAGPIYKLPDAFAVVNPKVGEYPFRDLCGAAVAFKLVQATLAEGKKRGIGTFLAVQDGWEKWLLDMVALATIADLMPLVGENRALVHYGLKVLRKSPRLGLRSLLARMRVRQSDLAEDDVAFLLAPRINAASRMGEPELAFQLLVTKDVRQAETLAAHLEDLNAKRKTAVATIVRQAKKRAAERFAPHEKVAVLGDTAWRPALLGPAANSIMEERGGVVCLWGRDANGVLKGSCRSDGTVSITELFVSAADAFVESGGHERSGGFSVSHEKVHSLAEDLARAVSALEERAIQEKNADHDALISLSEVSSALFSEVSRLSPFGIGNPKPLFLISDVIVTGVKRFGKESAHVELSLECRRTGMRARAFDFFRSPERFTHPPSPGKEARILGSIERDTFRGGLALRIIDVVPRTS